GGGIAQGGQLGVEKSGGISPLSSDTGRLLARYQRLNITGGRAVTGNKGHHCGIGKQKAAIGKRNEINSTRAWLVTQGNGIDHIFIVVVFLIDGQVAEALDGIEQQGNPVVLPVLIVKIILGRPRHVFGKAIALVDLTRSEERRVGKVCETVIMKKHYDDDEE